MGCDGDVYVRVFGEVEDGPKDLKMEGVGPTIRDEPIKKRVYEKG